MEKILREKTKVGQVRELVKEIEKNINSDKKITFKDLTGEKIFKAEINKQNINILLLKQSDVAELLEHTEFYLSRAYNDLFKISSKILFYAKQEEFNRELLIFEITEDKNLTIYKYNSEPNSDPDLATIFSDNDMFLQTIYYNNTNLKKVSIHNNNSIIELSKNIKKLSLSKLVYSSDNIHLNYIQENKKSKFKAMAFNGKYNHSLQIEIKNLLGTSKEIRKLKGININTDGELAEKIIETASHIIENNINLDINKITSKEEYMTGLNLGHHGHYKYIEYEKLIGFSKENTAEYCNMRLKSNLKTDNISFVTELENNYAFVSIDEQITSMQLADIITELKENLGVEEILIYAKTENKGASTAVSIKKENNTIEITKDKILVRDKKAFLKLSSNTKLILKSRETYKDIEYLNKKEITKTTA